MANRDVEPSAVLPDAPEIVSNVPGSFPWGVLHDRHPALIEQVREGLPYSPDRRRALDDLAEEITGVIRPLHRDAHDYELWADRSRGYLGERWDDVPFLWAESYFYRRLLDAVGYFGPGPWRGVDPFEPVKSAELHTRAFEDDLAAFDRLGTLAAAERDAMVVRASVWGNRADLGFRISARHVPDDGGHATALMVDQSPLLWALLEETGPGRVCVVADNSARELVADLLLADQLLTTGRARAVTLHVKPYPYYVSDATTADVLGSLRRLVTSAGRVAEAGNRLWQAVRDGGLTVRAHPFSCAPWSYHRMPADLAEEFATATVTVMKGDLNYRRLVGDRAWPAATPFEAVTAYFPGRVAALRTLKSDVAVGVPGDVLSRLDASGEAWRTSGRHAVIQVR